MACLFHEVLGIFRERLVVLVARLRLHLLSLTEFLNGLNSVGLGHSGILQYAARRRVHLQEGEQYGFDTRELVAVLLRKVLRTLQHCIGIIAQIGLTALHPRQTLHFAIDDSLYLCGIDTEFLEYERGNILGFCKHTFKQVHRLYALLSLPLRCVHGILDNLLCFDCKFVECHIVFLLSSLINFCKL